MSKSRFIIPFALVLQFRVWQSGFLAVKSFELESGYDFLYVDGASYTSVNGPDGVAVNRSSLVTFSSDYSVTAAGFEICFSDQPPVPAPTSMPVLAPTVTSASPVVLVSGLCGLDSDSCMTSPNFPSTFFSSQTCEVSLLGVDGCPLSCV